MAYKKPIKGPYDEQGDDYDPNNPQSPTPQTPTPPAGYQPPAGDEGPNQPPEGQPAMPPTTKPVPPGYVYDPYNGDKLKVTQTDPTAWFQNAAQWDTGGYSKPGYISQNYNQQAVSGYDPAKWGDPLHQTPKYVVGRILS